MLQLNRAKFSANGNCGYVLKPPCMCQGEAQGTWPLGAQGRGEAGPSPAPRIRKVGAEPPLAACDGPCSARALG